MMKKAAESSQTSAVKETMARGKAVAGGNAAREETRERLAARGASGRQKAARQRKPAMAAWVVAGAVKKTGMLQAK